MIPKKDLKIETMRGQGNGGQNRNKLDTACRITHIPTGISAYADTRTQRQSKKQALKTLEQRLRDKESEQRAAAKKARRDYAIHNEQRIRTYDYKSQTVKDHRTGKVASIRDIMEKGKLELLR